MKIVATLMVRDEADIIVPMVEHHLAQGVDLIIATDNGSVDGTAEILEKYAGLGVVELHHDPVHRKQQGEVVTTMARRARTHHRADWVINADADEFFVPVDRALTLRSALEAIPLALNAFTCPVTNLVGPPAERGSGVRRMLWRDRRSTDQLHAIGIHAHPTENSIHRGESDVVVSQGNHFVSLKSNGQPEAPLAIEVLHLPWRSWGQLERKVLQAGRAYEASPNLRPSPNHHGMADYRRLLAGRLRYAYLARSPSVADLEAGEAEGYFVRDEWLRDHLLALVPHARQPELLEAALDGSKDEPVDPLEHAGDARLGRLFLELERERDEARRETEEVRRQLRRARRRLRQLEQDRVSGRLPWPQAARRLLGPFARSSR